MSKRPQLNSLLRVLALAGAAAFAVQAQAAEEVSLYTTREPKLIQPLLDAFTKESGIKVNTVFVKDGLLERVKAEGAKSPADVLMTVDIGNLLDGEVTLKYEADTCDSPVCQLRRKLKAGMEAPDAVDQVLGTRQVH